MSGQKSEKPTPRRLFEARKKGEAARSREVVSAAVVACGLSFIVNGSTGAMNRAGSLLDNIILNIDRPLNELLPVFVHDSIAAAAIIGLPVLIAAVSVSLAAGIMQTGFMFTMSPLKPDLKRLNIAKNAARIIAPENLAMAGASIIKVTFLALLFWFAIKRSLNGLCFAPCGSGASAAKVSIVILKRITIDCCAMFCILAGADFLLQKKLFMKRMMMSKQEIIDEFKESEGDPLLRNLREQRREEILSQAGNRTNTSA
jgi:type III secretion protein U